LNESTALVTGGSGVLGQAIVRALVDAGWNVAFTYLGNAERARAVCAAIGPATEAFAFDLRRPEQVETLIEAVNARFGPVAALVNNAGMRRDALLPFVSDQEWAETLDTNLSGAFRLCRAVLPGMVVSRKGGIVNVASLSAERGLAGQAAYAASKAGLLAMTRVLAREYGKRNVRANAVLPGFVASELSGGIDAKQAQALRANEVLACGVTAESVAATVAFLLSDPAHSITGQALVVDAGVSC